MNFDVWCADQDGCPIGTPLWSSGPYETHFAWNYIAVDPPVSVCPCVVNPDPPSAPRFLITATHIGTNGAYPAWGFDNICTPIEFGCELHDYGCLPVLYPRPYNSYFPTMHSGYYGNGGFTYCPGGPAWFIDGCDTTANGTMYGFIEIAWRAYIICSGPTANEPSTWGNIKAMYR